MAVKWGYDWRDKIFPPAVYFRLDCSIPPPALVLLLSGRLPLNLTLHVNSSLTTLIEGWGYYGISKHLIKRFWSAKLNIIGRMCK